VWLIDILDDTARFAIAGSACRGVSAVSGVVALDPSEGEETVE
jgi:hypothetical protein